MTSSHAEMTGSFLEARPAPHRAALRASALRFITYSSTIRYACKIHASYFSQASFFFFCPSFPSPQDGMHMVLGRRSNNLQQPYHPETALDDIPSPWLSASEAGAIAIDSKHRQSTNRGPA